MKKISVVVIGAFFVCCIAVSQTFANGVLLDSMGPISSGRGGTNIAYSDNGTIIHDNPAALAKLKGRSFEGGTDFLSIPVNYQDQFNDKDAEKAFFSLPSFSYIQSYTQHPFGIGLGLYNPAGFSTEYYLKHRIYNDREQKYASNSSLTKILFGLGWSINDQWSLGIGIGPAQSKIELEGPFTFQTGALQGASALLDMNGDDWAMAWNVGLQWRVSSDTTLGLSYINQDKFNMRGDLNLKDPYIPNVGVLPLEANYNFECDFQWPQTLGVGLNHQFKVGHRISVDVLWVDWSSAFDELNFQLSEGDNIGFNLLTGGSSTQDTFPLHWKDSYAFRFGYEYLLNAADIIRLGYIYNQNPVPDVTLTPLIPGILSNLVSVGYGHNWKTWALNFAYQYSFGAKQSVATSKILGGDYDDSTIEISGHLFTMGVQYQF